MKCNYLFLALLACLLPWVQSTSKEDAIKNVSLIQLISNPDTYDGKMVRVSGYCCHSFQSALYLSKESAEFHITENSIWYREDSKTILEPINKDEFNKYRAANERQADGLTWQSQLDYVDSKFVTMEGIFRSDHGKGTGYGHGNKCEGELAPVKCVRETKKSM